VYNLQQVLLTFMIILKARAVGPMSLNTVRPIEAKICTEQEHKCMPAIRVY
jgi:hypothetical protein